MPDFKICSEYRPCGDQPKAIDELCKGLEKGYKDQTLLGVTGSGKTFTIANVIERTQRPTLVIAHNKTLAAQLCSEFREFFPNNSVEYFVSFYDYYQPEAYIPSTDTYIEKDSAINEEIDKLRHSATSALLERRDVIIVASVSCIYSLGDPEDYISLVISLRTGMHKDRDEIIKKLVDIQYDRNEIDFRRGKFRVRGDVLEVFPAATSEKVIRIEFFGDEIEKITEIDYISGTILGVRTHVMIFPASHYVTSKDKMQNAIVGIEEELERHIEELKSQNKILEAHRLEQRTRYDIEMMQEIGFCQGIENYSRYISQRAPGSAPYTLIDYFPKDFLLIIDESHVSIPQIGGMYNGDRARKETLVNFGFRLPSAFDNRPLMFKEFEEKINQAIFVSATPGNYERSHSLQVVEQIIRPTGLIDPEILVRPVKGQVDDLIGELNKRIEKNQRTLVTTLTKKMAEDLTQYLKNFDFKVEYLHSDIKTLERMEIIRNLRLGKFDILIGINLLREGLDLPEVSLVAILDADKEGFLRSETSLIQTIGRAARNIDGMVIMYADTLTNSMNKAISETNRRSKIQIEYNKKYNVTPKSVEKGIRDVIEATKLYEDIDNLESQNKSNELRDEDIQGIIDTLTKEMTQSASNLDFERAALIRDKIIEMKKKL